MRTFKYTYLDAKGNSKEDTIEADDKNDAYIILKTMRITPVSIAETETEDLSFEVIGQKEEDEKARKKITYAPARPAPKKKTQEEIPPPAEEEVIIEAIGPGVQGPGAGGGPTGKVDLASVLSTADLRRGETTKKKKKDANRPPYEMFGLFCAGVALLGWAAWATARDSANLDWPTAKGFITTSDLSVIGVFGKSYAPSLRYKYAVDGLVYAATNVFSEPTECTRGEAVGVVKRYPAGKKAVVYYNPADHEQCYLLQVSTHSTHMIVAALGLLCFSAATAMFVLAKLTETPKEPKKGKPKPSAGSGKKEPEIEISSWSAHVK